MKTTTLLKKLEEYLLFSENDVAKILVKSRPQYVRIMLYRLHKRGLIHRIEKGKYTVHSENPASFAAHIVHPSYLGLWTALRFHDLTTQLPKDINVMTAKARRKDVTLENGARIRFTKTKQFWGFRKERIGPVPSLVSDKEKTIIDCLLAGGKVPMWAVSEALMDEKTIDKQRLIDYAKRIKSPTLSKRLGFLLSKHSPGFTALEELKTIMDGNYVKLEVHGRAGGRRIKEWKIIENIRLPE